MASADFKTTLIKQSTLADITDQLDYAVLSGASSNTYQQFNAVSTSASSITFSLQVPSESIVVSREILIRTDINFTVDVTNVPIGAKAFDYGKTDALQAFPLNSLFSTSSAQINNTNVSVNTQDVLPQLLRLNNSRELYKYNSFCPSLPDQAYHSYADGVDAFNNPLGAYSNASYDVDLIPRGAFKLKTFSYVYTPVAGGSPDTLVSANVGDVWKISITVEVCEPIIGLSPFVFGDCDYNKQGLVGINALSFVFNIDSSCKRFFSCSPSPSRDISVSLGTSANPQPFEKCSLLVNFLSTQPSDLIPARNVVPYHDFPRFLSLQSATNPLGAGASTTVNSQNIQINQLPDYFIVCARKPMSQQTIKDSSSFAVINSISVNLNNASGLLSSATAQDLWRISERNGSTQNWLEFSGKASNEGNNDIIATDIATTGSLLILSPPFDLSLPDYLTSGSIGQYNFQLQMNITNQSVDAYTPEICIICVNSGVFTTVAGSSSIFTGILTKQMVLDSKTTEAIDPVSSVLYKRMIGGNLGNRIATAVKKMPFLRDLAGKLREMVGMGVPVGGGIMSAGGKLDALCA
ncbi:MAG: putative major capsid protein [Qinghai Lake virophage]|uniref:Putative major capsid protein n=1 Tax=Qinghai Lake virophage TaxID=1516115 RepID=A0A0R5K4M3_9VIRU|nr:MAG: putative major capsid protein [Qinghai Lake virophage]